MEMMKVGVLAFAVATCSSSPSTAETPDQWIALGARVHGAFGAFIPVGIKIGLDAVKRLNAKPRELTRCTMTATRRLVRVLPTALPSLPTPQSDNER